jgi:hypothetical protein
VNALVASAVGAPNVIVAAGILRAKMKKRRREKEGKAKKWPTTPTIDNQDGDHRLF